MRPTLQPGKEFSKSEKKLYKEKFLNPVEKAANTTAGITKGVLPLEGTGRKHKGTMI